MEDEARSSKGPSEKPPGLTDEKSAARRRTEEETGNVVALRPPSQESEPKAERPPGLTQMTPSARLRLQLVLDEEEARKPPKLPVPIDPRELRTVRSLSRWIGFCGLMTLTIGALTGLSYLTGTGSVAHVVVGILASALALWLLAAALSFHRVASAKRGARDHLVGGLGLLRSALLLKTILLFSAMVLGCFTFSLAASLLFLL